MNEVLQPSAVVGCRRKARALALTLFLGMLAFSGCGGSAPRVSGHITCDGKPVGGVILFSPRGTDGSNAGPAVTATLQEDGSYELQLTSPGKYTVVVTPRDINMRPKPGQFDYPCDRAPLERDVQAGDNEISIALPRRTR